MDSYWQTEASENFKTFAVEIFSMAPLCGMSLYFPPVSKKTFSPEFTLSYQEGGNLFYDRLLQELIGKDFRQYAELEKYFLQNMDSRYDMRFYGSALESLKKTTIPVYQIDWKKSSKEKLFLLCSQEITQTDSLSTAEQKNLAEYFGRLLFEERLLLSAWTGVVRDSLQNVEFLQISEIINLTTQDLGFVKEYVKKKTNPQNIRQSKIIYALELLKKYCPSQNLFALWADSLKQNFTEKREGEQKLLTALSKHGVVYKRKKEILLPAAKDLSWLLDSKRHKKNPAYKKSSGLYLLLLVLLYLLCRYF